MLTGDRVLPGLIHHPLQRCARKRCKTLVNGCHLRLANAVIGPRGVQPVDHTVKKVRVHQRGIAGDADYVVGLQHVRGQGVALQHIILGTAHHRNAFLFAPGRQGVVLETLGSGHRNHIERAAFTQTMDDVPEHRFADERQQHFPR